MILASQYKDKDALRKIIISLHQNQESKEATADFELYKIQKKLNKHSTKVSQLIECIEQRDSILLKLEDENEKLKLRVEKLEHQLLTKL